MTEIEQKCIINRCPSIYEYYPLGKEKQKCCYRYKDFFGEHTQCKNICFCHLKKTLAEYTFRKGTIQKELNFEWLEEYEYESKADKLKKLWKEL